MKIVCESCGAKYSIADEKVAGKVFKIRCKKCSAVIVVKGDQQQDGLEPTAVPGDEASDASWHVVVAGEQQGPFAPRQIGELLAEGKIDWEAYVWREGMDNWQPAKDVEALVKAVMAESEGGGESASVAPSGGLGGEVFGGSSDMGADPFASSDDGGLSGVIGSAAASSAATGGADLFADANRNAFAGASDDDDEHAETSHGAGAGVGPRVSEGQSLTGQRNENSVLFSLSNLQALATGSGAAPASTRAKPGMAQGEGSGLIDIRALASATQSVAERQNGSSRDKVEDLLAVGSANTTFSATALASPVAVEKPDHSKTLLYGMAAAILLLGVVVTFLATRAPEPQPTAQLTPAQDTAPAAAAGSAAATAPQAAEPAQADDPAKAAKEPSEQGGSEPEEEPAEEEADERSADRGDGRERERSSRRSSRERSSEKSSRSEKASAPVAAAPEPAPKKTSSGNESLDDLLNTALGGKSKPAAAAKPAPSENLPSAPSRDDVLGAMKGVTSKVQACGKGQSGIAMAKVTVAGPTGKVRNVDMSGQFAGTPAGSCIAKEVGKARFPKFSQSSFSFSYPFKI